MKFRLIIRNLPEALGDANTVKSFGTVSLESTPRKGDYISINSQTFIAQDIHHTGTETQILVSNANMADWMQTKSKKVDPSLFPSQNQSPYK